MKILIEGGDLNPPFTEGTRNIVRDYTQKLSAKGHDMVIITRYKSKISNQKFKRTETINGIRFYRWKNYFDLFLLYRRLAKNENIDIIHIFAKGIRPTFYLKLLKRIIKKPIIYSLIGLPSFSSEKKSIKATAKNLKLVTTCLISSKTIYNTLKANGLKNIIYLPYGIDVNRFDKSSTKACPNGKIFLICLRPPTPEVISAFKKINQTLPNAYLILNTRDKKPQLNEKIKNIIFTKPNENMETIYNCATLAIDLHNNKEFLECASPPAAILEAMACKVRVISTKIPEIEEVIQDNKNGFLIKNNDSEEICLKIKKALNSNKKIAENARKTILQTYNLDCLIPKYEQIYKNLCGGSEK